MADRRQPKCNAMTLHYYPETDSLYIDLADAPSVESEEVRPGVVLDFGADGRLVGIDIDRASKKAALDRVMMHELPLRAPAAPDRDAA